MKTLKLTVKADDVVLKNIIEYVTEGMEEGSIEVLSLSMEEAEA